MLAAFCATSWAASEKVLYRFHGADGNVPGSVIQGPDGALYGTTGEGGANPCQGQGCGVIFRLTQGTDGKWREAVLHNFTGSDGWFPEGPLVADKAGSLYGMTVYGGPSCSQLGCGVVFGLVRGNGNKWTFKVLHDFAVTDGANPYAGLIFDSKGNLYGTTSYGGNTNACTGGCGVVFELSPDGRGSWTGSVLYSFSGDDGANPYAPLTFDGSGRLYGTTNAGGVYGSGTVFRLTSSGGGQWKHEILHSFDETDGQQPGYGVTLDGSGNVYGTTPAGGAYHWGVAFMLASTKGGKWKETILRNFDEHNFDGGDPSSGLLLDGAGDLYGTVDSGGRYDCRLGGGLGCGVAFRLTQLKNGKWSETVLHSFGKSNDGAFPGGDLARGSAGRQFGTTATGGYTGGPCVIYGCGVVFEITP